MGATMPVLDEQDVARLEAARRDPVGWLDSMGDEELATLFRYDAALAFLGIEENVLHNAVLLLDAGRLREARELLAFRARATQSLLSNLRAYGINQVDASADRDWWPLIEKARQSMAQAGVPVEQTEGVEQ